MPRLNKQQARQIYREMRALWNEWNPYGVPSTIEDEYDSFLAKTLHMLEAGASTMELVEYLSNFGNGGTTVHGDATAFANKLQAWFSERWPDAKF